MLKKLLTIFTFVALLGTYSFAQWTNQGVWPDARVGQAHGIAVDPDGKVWVVNFAADDSVFNAQGTKVSVRTIRVYNPDGTTPAWAPIKMLTVGGVTDTLINSSRGLRADDDGNMIYVEGAQNMYRINYQTGEGMDKVALALGTSPISPGVADDGTIFVGPVVPGNPIKIFDKQFNYLGNAVDATVGFSRTMTVSGDGNTIYWAGYTNHALYVYQRPDEFSSFDSVGVVLEGFDCESLDWNPKDGMLWASAGSFNDLPNRYPGVTTNYSPNTWYGYDFYSGQVLDSLKWTFVTPDNPAERPRGIGFSPDGDIAYVGVFGASVDLLQKVTRDVTPVDVTFRVNMTVQVNLGQFTPGTDVMNIAGSFNGWSTSATPMTDAGNNIWEATVTGLAPGERQFFKFVKNADGWETISDRQYIAGTAGNQFEAYFDNDLGGGIDIALVFECDMELERVSGRFNPSTDVLTARGSFNGWGNTDVMAPSVGNPDIYTVTVMYAAEPNDDLAYKFAYDLGAGGTSWENGSDRHFTITQDHINQGYATISRAFNDASLSSVLAQPCEITFSVDMTGAKDAGGVPFTSIENVIIAGAIAPLAWPQGGWPTADSNLVHHLNDLGTNGDLTAADQIWSVSLEFPQYSLLQFFYKYGANWGLPSNNGTNDNESSTGVDHSIVLEHNYVSCRTLDVWQDMSPADLTDIITGLEEIPGLPNEYSLDQNYPNPFNPTTIIRFSVKEAGFVSVKVFDLLGQEVATLISDNLNRGAYEVNFNASDLTSGMYVYTIQAGNFVSSKKMLLIK
ncbi:MAG: T9SS type A sorting domain-containing protein [Ignavibacteriales bacterium]|nr:T9SS type A sorting domain-containing protein [Ignavibacteriales bacterium]MCF8437369.1 T9SS type A sorting domain-containing protein [Ignavibacteriales bacterium]